MKLMFTMHFRNTPAGRRELWQMASDGWRHRAYIVRQPGLGTIAGDGALHGIEVSVYNTNKAAR